ncbi:GDP-mannose 4,6-dehydratase [Rhodovulum sulfidophilum]|nr:GDP-mannose 4,6-dehydratase [Rhodovulum sulfidophilum]
MAALTYTANAALVADSPLYTFAQADIRDPAALDAAFATHRPDIFLHLAAESHVDRYMALLHKSREGFIL